MTIKKKIITAIIILGTVLSTLCISNQSLAAKTLITNCDRLENSMGIQCNYLTFTKNNIYETWTGDKDYEKAKKESNDKVKKYYEEINPKNNDNEIIDKLWAFANKLSQEARYKELIEVLDVIIKRCPNDKLAYQTRAYAKISTNDCRGAIKDLSTAISFKNEPMFVQDYNSRAICYMELRKYKNAINDFNKYLIDEPNDAIAYARRGYSYSKINDTNNAILDYLKAAAIYDREHELGYHDSLMKEIHKLLHKTYDKNHKKLYTLFPTIKSNFDFLSITSSGSTAFYINPTKWKNMPYKNKIILYQETVFYMMIKELFADETPMYTLSLTDPEIRSSIDGTLLIKKEPQKGRKTKYFENITLQNISENFLLTAKYSTKEPKTQKEIVTSYKKLVKSFFESSQHKKIKRTYKFNVYKDRSVRGIELQSPPWIDGVDEKAIKIIDVLGLFFPCPENYDGEYIEINETFGVNK